MGIIFKNWLSRYSDFSICSFMPNFIFDNNIRCIALRDNPHNLKRSGNVGSTCMVGNAGPIFGKRSNILAMSWNFATTCVTVMSSVLIVLLSIIAYQDEKSLCLHIVRFSLLQPLFIFIFKFIDLKETPGSIMFISV